MHFEHHWWRPSVVDTFFFFFWRSSLVSCLAATRENEFRLSRGQPPGDVCRRRCRRSYTIFVFIYVPERTAAYVIVTEKKRSATYATKKKNKIIITIK